MKDNEGTTTLVETKPHLGNDAVLPTEATPGVPPRRLLGVIVGFVVTVAMVMLIGRIGKDAVEPWRSPTLAEARAELLKDPKNETLKGRIRELDRGLRESYFRTLERNRTGAWMMVTGTVVLVAIAHFIGKRAPKGLLVVGSVQNSPAVRRQAGRTLLMVGLGWLGFCLVYGFAFRVRLTDVASSVTSEVETQVLPATDAKVERRSDEVASPAATAVSAVPGAWPQFRGVGGSGGDVGELGPSTWNVEAGTGVVWKVVVPLKGFSSPIVWKDHVFLTGGDKESRQVMAFDAVSGRALWSRPVIPTEGSSVPIEPPDQSGAAASTPATDGERVYAIFATGELGALDFSGKRIWGQRLDLSGNGYGHASSLVVSGGKLYVQADQGAIGEGKSRLLALDAKTGETQWNVKRPVAGSWCTPLLTVVGGVTQLILGGDPWLMAYEAGSGREIWRAKVLGGELAPSPVVVSGMVLAASPGQALWAVRLGGAGDVTASGVAWKTTDDVPDVPSPVASGELLLSVNTEGKVVCRELATGTKQWQHAIEAEVQASPVLAGDRVYIFAQPGTVLVLRMSRQREILGTLDMKEEVYATPAIVGGRLFVRTDRSLFCLGGSADDERGGIEHVR